jgi:hypothetical protein
MPFVAVDHDPFAAPDAPQPGTPNVPPTALPQAGDRTPMSGNPMAGMGVTSPYQNDQDWDQIGLYGALSANGNTRGLPSIIQNTPGHQAATEYAKKIAGDKAELANTQRGVIPMLQALDGLEKRYTEAGPKVAPLATGPNYAGDDPWNPFNHLLPDTSSPAYQNLRAKLTPSALDPNDEYGKAADLNNQMQHAKEGIATLFKAIPGSGKSGATDQAQTTLSEMVNAALHARDPETFYRIMHDAKNFIRGLGQFPQLPEPKGWTPPEWQKPQTAQGGAAQPQAPQQAASAPRPRAVNPQTGHAVEWNGQQWVDAQ